ncbi:MAG: hypothetical protein U9P88_02130 [Patescibacteria group bacterium]|nr:hypothetical protein [Patescibacteria group bacterium]
MKEITERQSKILNIIISDYIESVQPVSSQILKEKYNFKMCPATIRNEMQKLTNQGYLLQLYASSGKIPSDKGYRFFVNELIEKDVVDVSFKSNISKKKRNNLFNFVQWTAKTLSSDCSNLGIAYIFEDDFTYKEGWEDVIQEPEFEKKKYVFDFTQLIKNFEENMPNLKIIPDVKIYIGKENPFSKTKDFSIIIRGCCFPKNRKGVLAILGPKRMTYQKNIRKINSLVNWLNKH